MVIKTGIWVRICIYAYTQPKPYIYQCLVYHFLSE